MAKQPTEHVEFDDNRLLPELFGEHNAHLDLIEKQLGVIVSHRGNRVSLSGPANATSVAVMTLRTLYEQLKKGDGVGLADVKAAMRMVAATDDPNQKTFAYDDDNLMVVTRLKKIKPRSPTQAQFIQSMRKNSLVFGLGPAGTGKTYLAVAMAVALQIEGRIDRIILCRPAVEAGESLGFLPGDMKEKIDPYLRPLYDALHDMIPFDQVEKKMMTGDIEVAPLAFMRGRTLSNAFVILDEAQNTTSMQMKMLLTRLGENSRMVVTGDLSQIDLPGGQSSGLKDAVAILQDIEGIDFIHFSEADVVRHALVSRIVKAYDNAEKPKAKHKS